MKATLVDLQDSIDRRSKFMAEFKAKKEAHASSIKDADAEKTP